MKVTRPNCHGIYMKLSEYDGTTTSGAQTWKMWQIYECLNIIWVRHLHICNKKYTNKLYLGNNHLGEYITSQELCTQFSLNFVYIIQGFMWWHQYQGLKSPYAHSPGLGVTKAAFVNFSVSKIFEACKSTCYILWISFIFDRCHGSWVAATPVKY